MEYLSPSRIHLYEQCGLSFSFKYIQVIGEEDSTTDWYSNYGTLHHEIYEGIAKKEIVSLDQAIRKFDEGFPNCNIPDNSRGTYYKQGLQGIEQKFNDLQKMNIVDAEKEFKVPIDFTMPPLYGFIDLVYRDEQGRLIVRDYKTSKIYDKTNLSKQYQPYVYPIACKAVYGEYPFKFEFDFVRFGETREFIITEKFIKMGLIKLKGIWNNIKSGKFQANYNPFFCENFCAHRSICPLYLKKKGF